MALTTFPIYRSNYSGKNREKKLGGFSYRNIYVDSLLFSRTINFVFYEYLSGKTIFYMRDDREKRYDVDMAMKINIELSLHGDNKEAEKAE